MRKILLGILLLFCGQVVPVEAMNLRSQNVIIIDDEQVLYEQHADEVIQPASLTKMMSALVASDYVNDLSDYIVYESWMAEQLVGQNASTAYYQVGEHVQVKDAILTLMFASAADAALMLEHYIGEVSGRPFVELMNEKAQSLGMSATHFSNVHGLDDEGLYTSAADMALLVKHLYEHPFLKEALTQERVQYTTNMGNRTYVNKLKVHPTLLLGKTGYTYGAGYCLASVHEYEGRIYYVVVMNADPFQESYQSSIQDTYALLNYAHESYHDYVFVEKDTMYQELPFSQYQQGTLQVGVKDDVQLRLHKEANLEPYQVELKMDKLTKTVKKDEVVGELRLSQDGVLISTHEVYALHDVELKWIYQLFYHFQEFWYIYLAGCLLVLNLIAIRQVLSSKHKRG